MDHIVCTLEVGSRVKGYNIEGSDHDVIHFVKSPKCAYIRHFIGFEDLLKNCHIGEDVVRSNLLTGLVGIYTGNYPYLWLFGNEETLKNEPELLAFVQLLGSLRLKLILRNLARYGKRPRDTQRLSACSPKTLLQTLYSLSMVDYCLTHRSRPQTTTQLAILHILPSKYRDMFENLMAIRRRDVERRDEKTEGNSPLPATHEEELITYADTIHKYREDLWNQIEGMPDPDERPDLLKSITDYFLYDVSLPAGLR